jgi:hypothetical protein
MKQMVSTSDWKRSAGDGLTSFVDLGKSAIASQRELLDVYEKICRLGVERAQLEIALWSGLAKCLTASRSMLEVLEAFTKCLPQQMHSTTNVDQRPFSERQQNGRKINGIADAGRQ